MFYKNWNKIFVKLNRRLMKKINKYKDYRMMLQRENQFL